MVPIIITLVFFHGIWDPVRFLALTMETSSTAQFLKSLGLDKRAPGVPPRPRSGSALSLRVLGSVPQWGTVRCAVRPPTALPDFLSGFPGLGVHNSKPVDPDRDT